MTDHTDQGLRRRLARDQRHGRPRWAASSRSRLPIRSTRSPTAIPTLGNAPSRSMPSIDPLQHAIEEKAVLTIARRQPMAIDLRGHHRCAAHRQRPGKGRRSRQEHRQAGRAALGRRASRQSDARRRTDGRAGAGAASARCSTATPSRSSTWRSTVWNGDEEIDSTCAHRCSASCSTYMMEDAAQHHLLHPPDVLRQEHRAHGRSCDQYRRDGILHHRRPRRSPSSAQG